MTPSPSGKGAPYAPQDLVGPGFIGGENLDMEGIGIGRINAVLDTSEVAPGRIAAFANGDDIDINHPLSRYPIAAAPRVERSAHLNPRRPLALGVG